MSDTQELTIADLGAQGDGIAHHDGATWFVPGTLAGERVRVKPGMRDKDLQRAELNNILTPSPDRAAAPCPHFPRCGGCRLQHMSDTAYSAWKIKQLMGTLEREGLHDAPLLPPIVTAPGTRRRARLAASHGKDGVTLGFNAWRSHDIVNQNACPVLLPQLEQFIQALREALPLWLPEGGSCDVQLTALRGGIDMVLIGGPALGLAERENLAMLAERLNIAKMSWRKWDRSPIEPVAHRLPLTVTFGGTDVPFPPASFLQATQSGETALFDFTRRAVGQSAKILDLFCGLGGFGLSLPDAQQVSFIDLDGPAVTALEQVARRSPRYRVEQRNLIREPVTTQESNAFDAVVFDPPHGGAKAQAEQLAHSHVPHVVAISCDPPSFARDAAILLRGGYRLQSLQPVDQFLWSTHLELAAHFTR